MLTFSFFTAVFLTISWLLYIGTYIYTHVNGALTAVSTTDLAIYIALILIPLLVVWNMWSVFYRFYKDNGHQRKFLMLEARLKQNQYFLELVTRLIYQGQKTQGGHFVLNQTEFLVSEMNGLIADILHRYNFISESENEALWKSDNKWGFAKALITLNSSNSGFEDRIFKTALQENLLKGTINEFCARYASLIDILKKYDSEKIYLNIIETGALGKAFAILAPLADRIKEEIENENKQLSFLYDDNFSGKSELNDILPENTDDKHSFKEDRKNLKNSLLETDEDNESLDNVLDGLENLKSPEDFILEENTPTPINDNSSSFTQSSEENNIQTSKSLDIEISSMFDGAGVRGDDTDEEDKNPFLPKIKNLFKKRGEKKVSPSLPYEVDPLTLALERSFGKLSENAPVITSRLDKVLESGKEEEKNKFSFTGTNETIMKLQQELEQLHNPEKEEKID